MDILKDLFADKLDVDDRDPVATFQIPGVDGSFELLPPKVIFWVQLTVVRTVNDLHKPSQRHLLVF